MFDLAALADIVLKGQRVSRVMPDFGTTHDRNDLITVSYFVRKEAIASRRASPAAS